MRSTLEMAGVLAAMRDDADVVTASVGHNELLFLTRLLEVDAAQRIIVVAFCENKPANAALLEERQATFRCNHRATHYEFTAGNAREVDHGGAPAVALDFPDALVALQRRAHPRHEGVPRVPLRCEVRLGVLSFDAHIVDISLQGLGALIYDAGVRLEPGSVLKGVRILHPERASITVDLELRYLRPVMLRDGTRAVRAGCRILGKPQDIEALMRLFVTELR
ncbi:MAG: flagellar brake protein [Betaproteobacteria bacterium]